MNSSSDNAISDGWWIDPQPRRRDDGKLCFELCNRIDDASLNPVLDFLIDRFQGLLVSELHGPEGTSIWKFVIRGIGIVLVADNWGFVEFFAENQQDEPVAIALAGDLQNALGPDKRNGQQRPLAKSLTWTPFVVVFVLIAALIALYVELRLYSS